MEVLTTAEVGIEIFPGGTQRESVCSPEYLHRTGVDLVLQGMERRGALEEAGTGGVV